MHCIYLTPSISSQMNLWYQLCAFCFQQSKLQPINVCFCQSFQCPKVKWRSKSLLCPPINISQKHYLTCLALPSVFLTFKSYQWNKSDFPPFIPHFPSVTSPSTFCITFLWWYPLNNFCRTIPCCYCAVDCSCQLHASPLYFKCSSAPILHRLYGSISWNHIILLATYWYWNNRSLKKLI